MIMDYTNANVTRLSLATGCSKEVVDKALAVTEVTETIFSYTQSSCLALKGASARNMLYPALRINTEIELEYIGAEEADRENIRVNLRRMLMQYTPTCFDRISSTKGQTEAYASRYSNYNRHMNRFSLTIDYGTRETEPVIRKTVKVLGYEGDVPVNTFGLDKLNRDILDALVTRTSPVDVYDVFCYITDGGVKSHEDLYAGCCQDAGRYSAEDLAYSRARLGSLAERDFRYFLEPLLPAGTAFDWRKAVDVIASLL
ncbi:MAG: hypothetical protein LUE27_09365 [Clostridia bacterium]|nr:hypothetical protein [Clostridia bacterium]